MRFPVISAKPFILRKPALPLLAALLAISVQPLGLVSIACAHQDEPAVQGDGNGGDARNAAAALSLQPQQQNGIAYLVGGVGDGERDTMKAARPSYSTQITSAYADGAFSGDITLVVRRAESKSEAVRIVGGPLFLINLPAGRYSLEASNDGKTQRRDFTVGKGKPTEPKLVW